MAHSETLAALGLYRQQGNRVQRRILLMSAFEDGDRGQTECRRIADHVHSALRRIGAISEPPRLRPHPAEHLGRREAYRAGDFRAAVEYLERLTGSVVH